MDKCPICGYKGYSMFIAFECTNIECENYVEGTDRVVDEHNKSVVDIIDELDALEDGWKFPC